MGDSTGRGGGVGDRGGGGGGVGSGAGGLGILKASGRDVDGRPCGGVPPFGVRGAEPFRFEAVGSIEDFRRWCPLIDARTLGLAVAVGGVRLVGEGGPGPRRERPLGAGDVPTFGGLVARGEPGGTDERTEGTRGELPLARTESEGRYKADQQRVQRL